jgi:hypothetical protein
LPEPVNDTVRQSGAMKMNTGYAVPLARNREMLDDYRRRLEEELAQLVERLIRNQQVAGWIPAGGSRNH